VAEVSHKVMKYLRASEKSLRRTIAATSYSDDDMPAEKNTELCKKELSGLQFSPNHHGLPYLKTEYPVIRYITDADSLVHRCATTPKG